MLKILDIAKLSALAKRKGAVSVVDNTFMSPYFQRPLELGATIVVHSATKYINGHSDMVGGALITSDAAMGFAASRLVGGVTFSLGLILVVVAGAAVSGRLTPNVFSRSASWSFRFCRVMSWASEFTRTSSR